MDARVIATIAVGAAVALGTGCGGDSSPIEPITTGTTGETTGQAALSKRQFIERADAACAEANAAIAGLQTGDTPQSLAAAAGQEQEITRGIMSSIDALAAPEDPTGVLAQFEDGLKRQISISGRRQRAAQSGDTATYDALGDQLAQAKADTRLAAEEYGFQECGQEGTAVAPTTTEPSGGTPAPAPAPAPAPTPAPAPAPAPAPGGGGGGGGGGSSGGISPG